MKREASSDPEDPPVTKRVRLLPQVTGKNQLSSLKVKGSAEGLFGRLCRDFGWTPTELFCAKIIDLLDIDTSKSNHVEPALFAFVQHVPFVWDDGALFIGCKTINKAVRTVWYKPALPGCSVKTSTYIGQKDSFAGDTILKTKSCHNGSVVDRIWPSFTTIFGMSNQGVGYKYLMGVHTILLEFPKLRKKSCSDHELRAWSQGRLTSATDHVPLKKHELPFLPESVWMSKPVGWRPPQVARPMPPSGGVSSRSNRQPSSTTTLQTSANNIDRVQSLTQLQRGQIIADHKHHERLPSELRRHNILNSEEPLGATNDTSEAAMEASLNASLQVERKPTPNGPLDLNAVDHVNQILQNNNVDISFGRSDCTAEAQVQLAVTFPAHISQQQSMLQLSPIASVTSPTPILQQQLALQFSPVSSIDLAPIVPHRHLVLDALCALVMSTTDDDNWSRLRED